MFIYLDTETTGLSASSGAKIVEIALVDEDEHILLNTLVDPEIDIPWQASNVHGITNSMVSHSPTIEDILDDIKEIIACNNLVIYNSAFDTQFFPSGLCEANEIFCAMKIFASQIGSRRYVKLLDAAHHVGHEWRGDAHRALSDTLACKSVWEWLQNEWLNED